MALLPLLLCLSAVLIGASAGQRDDGQPADPFASRRCRCVCPNRSVMRGVNSSVVRYYTDTALGPDKCDAPNVLNRTITQVVRSAWAIGNVTEGKIEDEVSKFILRCMCKYETRNVTLIKVVIILVMVIIFCLVAYMLFLLCLDPMLRRQRANSVQYQRHNDDADENNIFSDLPPSSSADANSDRRAASSTSSPLHGRFEVAEPTGAATTADRQFRAQVGGVLGKVEAEQSRWMEKVEVQRRKIFTDHTMLN